MTRSDIARQSNDHLAERATHLHFVSRVPMLCECGDNACTTIVLVSLDAYRALREDPSLHLTAPGHTIEDARQLHGSADYWIQRPG